MRPVPYALLLSHGLLAAAVCLASAPALAGDMTAECPRTIPAESFVAGKPPAGWTGFVPHQLHLDGAGMMAGPPQQMEYLVPNRVVRESQVYEFQRGDRQRWLWCMYGGGVQLSRKLDDTATHCTVVEKRRGKALINAAVQCR